MAALEQNASLLHLNLCYNHGFSERDFLAYSESLPEINVLQRVELSWCPGLASVMQNTSFFRFHVAVCAPSCVPTTPEVTARCAGSSVWVTETTFSLLYLRRNRHAGLVDLASCAYPDSGIS
jgi:hypothetical protein